LYGFCEFMDSQSTLFRVDWLLVSSTTDFRPLLRLNPSGFFPQKMRYDAQ
jgi:hypothetical protein